MTPAAYSGTQSVVRALRILKLFSLAPRLGLAEIRERVGLNRSTVFRLLTALEAEGLLERDPAGDGFRLGREMATLGRRALGRGDLPEIAGPFLASLASEVNETVTLERLATGTAADVDPDFDLPCEVVIAAEAMGEHVVSAQPSLGTRWPAHATSTGKVLLAALDSNARRRWIRTPPAAVTQHTIADGARLLEELERVAERGWATSLEELEPGYVAVAVPVLDPRGETVAALSIGGPKHRLSRERLEGMVAPMRLVAAAILAELRT